MSVVVMYECPKCGKRFEEDHVFKYVDPEGKEWPVNGIQISYYDHKKRQTTHVAYGRDMCSDCMRPIVDQLMSGVESKIKMHEVKQKEVPSTRKTNYSKLRRREPESSLEAEQNEFASTQVDDNDGE